MRLDVADADLARTDRNLDPMIGYRTRDASLESIQAFMQVTGGALTLLETLRRR
jgi:hypothetical protein